MSLLWLLHQVNKREAIALTQVIVQKIAAKFSSESDKNRHLTVTAAIVENPLDGRTANKLFSKAVLFSPSRGRAGIGSVITNEKF